MLRKVKSIVFISIIATTLLFTSCSKSDLSSQDETEILRLCPGKQITRIHAIQGIGHRSPFEGEQVTCVTGIVTAVTGQGFYLQDLIEDDDERSSEALFVAYSSASTIKRGDRIFIEKATVQEHNPSINRSNSLTITRLINSSNLQILSSQNPMPDPVVLGEAGRFIPNQIIENDVVGYVGKDKGLFDPEEDGMDFFESLESMYVEVREPLLVSSTNRFNEVSIVADNGRNANLISDTGAIVIRENDFNPERIMLDDTFINIPKMRIGTKLLTPVRGVVGYNFANYRIMPIEPMAYIEEIVLAQKVEVIEGANLLSIASYNVENLSASDNAIRFTQLAKHVVNGLNSPDILVLQEVLDNDGSFDSKNVSADQTLSKIIQAIRLNDGPEYKFLNIDPERNADGGIKGGNGRIVILYREDTGLSFEPINMAGPRTETEIVNIGNRLSLSHNPGRIWPNNSCFRQSRKALISQFTFNGQDIFIIGVHFSSKGEDGPLYGEIQPPPFPSEDRRVAQAKAVNGFVKRILEVNPHANIVVLGDINDFYWTEPVITLIGNHLKNTTLSLPEKNRYTYVYEGNGQMMDQIFLSKSLYDNMESFQIVHLNTVVPELDAFSDHDPVIVYLNMK